VVGHLLGAGVLGDSFCALRHEVFDQLARQQLTQGGLDLPTADRRSFIAVCKIQCFGSDPLENVVHEWLDNAHNLAWNSSVRVHLFQHFVNIDVENILVACAALLLVGQCSVLDAVFFVGHRPKCVWNDWKKLSHFDHNVRNGSECCCGSFNTMTLIL